MKPGPLPELLSPTDPVATRLQALDLLWLEGRSGQALDPVRELATAASQPCQHLARKQVRRNYAVVTYCTPLHIVQTKI